MRRTSISGLAVSLVVALAVGVIAQDPSPADAPSRVALSSPSVEGDLPEPLVAPPPPVASPGAPQTLPAGPTVADAQERIDALEADTTMEESIKEGLRARYTEAIEILATAATNRAQAARFRAMTRSAPGETAELQQQLAALPSVEQAAAVQAIDDVDRLNAEIDLRRLSLSELNRRFDTAGAEQDFMRGRPLEIAARLQSARKELADVENALAVPGTGNHDSPTRIADRFLLGARREAVAAEVELLQQERETQPGRERLLQARWDLLSRQRENDRASLAALEVLRTQSLLTGTERLIRRVDELTRRTLPGGEDIDTRLNELQVLSRELQESIRQLEAVNNDGAALTMQMDELSAEFERIDEQVKLGGLEGALVQVLFEQRRRLPNPKVLSHSIRERQDLIRRTQLAQFQVRSKLRAQPALEDPSATDAPEAVSELVAAKGELLLKLQQNYQALIPELVRLDADEHTYRNAIVQFQDYLSEKLFWKRSSPPIGIGFLMDTPSTLRWIVRAEGWREGGRALRAIPLRHPLGSIAIVALMILLVAARPRIIAAIVESGVQTRRISTDRYAHTLRALAGTVLLALPVALALGYIGWAVLQDPVGSAWTRGVGFGLSRSAIMVAGAAFLMACCRKGSLCMDHFGWPEEAVLRLRTGILALFAPYVLVLPIMGATFYQESASHFDSVGRLSFMLANLWIALELGRLLRPADGILSQFIREHPRGLVARSGTLVHALVILVPLLLVVLAGVGYVLTAVAWSFVFLGTLWLTIGGVLLYELVLRWFMIKRRRLAQKEALLARRAAVAAEAASAASGGEVIVVNEDELTLDLGAVVDQTRRLLRSVVGVGMIVFIWLFWTGVLPLEETLGGVQVGRWLNVLTLAQAVLVMVVAAIVVRNLPGLLDLAGFRDSGMDAGIRYAFTTICQYVLVAIALVMLARILNLDWSQFGWIAAALSVGLGFGLQEVVANFVCGIILLFECPIRVGDIVTLDNVTGTVSRIRMRATTITNWDRQEYIVPNKQFITGALVNWTLSNPVNRIVLSVGVAYGSDTGKAREMLLDIARTHPEIMEDPAPVTSFEAFGDSALDLRLRCYLPNMDNRLKTISELHSSIDQRFHEAGIEIAYPQRELHIRSVAPGAFPGGRPQPDD